MMDEEDGCNESQQGSSMHMNGLEAALDESLYSRQLYVLGKDAMRRMAKSDVLLSGVGGLGVEIAKNIILGGIKSLTMHDPRPVEWQDLSSQYYLTESDIGLNRAGVSLGHLSSLNPYVNVQLLPTASLTTEILSNYNVLVLTEGESTSPDVLLELTDFCHQNGIAVVLAQTNGLFGRIFCDFGEDFVVLDSNGKEPLTRFVANATQAKEAVVTCTDRHGFYSGDHVVFREVGGMVELNTMESMQITVTGPFSFSVNFDTSAFGAYLRDGTVAQVKVPRTVSYKSYRDSVKDPKIINYNYAKLDHPPTLHVAYDALNKFILEQGRVPRSWDEEDADIFVALAQKSAAAGTGTGSGTSLKTELLRQFSFVARGQLAPVNGIIGGIAAQEVMKACSGKFSPINQWLYLDAIECLSDSPPEKSDFEAKQSRYDGQTAVFGNLFQNKLAQQHWFVVGAGAIGCELLKNFGMMGIGHLTVTDMDFIERSNLNRQFLFRPENVGQSKALTAKAAIQKMNPLITIEAHENRVGTSSEGVYGEEFYGGLNGVANALDNVEARLYMDRQCIRHRLPLLESGTMGTKGNVQVVLPFVTESYGSVKEGPKDEIPLCTLKSFPNAIEHTLQWARDLFQGLFTQPMENALSYLKDPAFLQKLLGLPGDQSFEALKSLYQVLKDDRPFTFEDCVTWARWQWEDHFRNQILQLLFNFPPDTKTSSGLHFWEAPKRCPQPLEFTLENDGELALNFVFTAANLRADCYGIEREGSKRRVKEILENVHVPPFTPQAGVTIPTTEDEAEAAPAPAPADLDLKMEITDKIRSLDCTGLTILPLEFEKDSDSNLHMDFVVACSNSRASNYGIAHADRLKSKLIAGKIIPAIATTTSVVAGFVGLELIKIVQGVTSIEKLSNVFINLAIPKLTITQPAVPPLKIYNGVKWTLWDTIDVEGELTVGEFIDWFAKEHKLQVDMISQDQGTSVLYAWFWSQEQIDAMLPLSMVQAVENVTGQEVGRDVSALFFEVCCNELDGEELPPVRYLMKGKTPSSIVH